MPKLSQLFMFLPLKYDNECKPLSIDQLYIESWLNKLTCSVEASLLCLIYRKCD